MACQREFTNTDCPWPSLCGSDIPISVGGEGEEAHAIEKTSYQVAADGPYPISIRVIVCGRRPCVLAGPPRQHPPGLSSAEVTSPSPQSIALVSLQGRPASTLRAYHLLRSHHPVHHPLPLCPCRAAPPAPSGLIFC
ncbi:hypothetical protein J6590_062365 [Homalodisca vitripennis]|nr:hypothetical protein J6590_062365 [Homalodisca vitripennis]